MNLLIHTLINLLWAHNNGIQFSIHGILPWRVFQEEIDSLL